MINRSRSSQSRVRPGIRLAGHSITSRSVATNIVNLFLSPLLDFNTSSTFRKANESDNEHDMTSGDTGKPGLPPASFEPATSVSVIRISSVVQLVESDSSFLEQSAN